MGTRLSGTYYNTGLENGLSNQFDISIDDSSYSSSVIPFSLKNLRFKWTPKDNERFNTIFESSCEIEINVDSSDVNDFVNDLTGAAEQRFTVKIDKNSSLYWVGLVQAEQVNTQDRGYNNGKSFRLKAVDGIARLKTTDYNNSGTAYSGKETFLEHLFNIIGKIPLSSYWGASDIQLDTMVNWWEDSQTYAANTCPLTLTRFDHRAFIFIDESATKLYKTSYEVLDEICKIWGVRFFFADGRYRFHQVNEYANTGTVVIRHFLKDGSYDSNTSSASLSMYDAAWGNPENFTQSSIKVIGLAEGNYSSYPALNRVINNYNHFLAQNLAAFAAWSDSSAPTFTVNDVSDNAGTSKILFSFRAFYSVEFNAFVDFQPCLMKFRLTCSLASGGTTYYLKRRARVNSNGSITRDQIEWATTLDYYEFFSEGIPLNDVSLVSSYSIETPVLPDEGDLSLVVGLHDTYNLSGRVISDLLTEDWSITRFSMELLVDGTFEGQYNITRYESTNGDSSNNSAELVFDTLLGDGPTLSALSHIEASDGVNWTVSTAWRKGNSGTYDNPIGELLAREIMSGQTSPVDRWFGRLKGDLAFYNIVNRDLVNFICSGVSYDAKRDIWDGEWFAISSNPLLADASPEDALVDPNRPRYDGRSFPLSVSTDGPGRLIPVGPAPPMYPDISPLINDGLISEDATISNIPIRRTSDDEFVLEGDIIRIVSPVGTDQGAYVDESTTGETQIGTRETTAFGAYEEGASLLADAEQVQASILWGRRKFFAFQLYDYDENFTTSASWTTIARAFFRPYKSGNAWDLAEKKYIRQILWSVGVSEGTATPQYDLRVYKNSGATTVLSSVTISGENERAAVTGDYELLEDDVYLFQIRRTDGGSSSHSTGLRCELEIVNKNFEPSDITGLQLWLRSDAGVTTSSGAVTDWADQSGNSNDASQSTSASRPALNTTGQNGYPYLTFDGSDDYMLISSVLGLTDYPFTIFAVFNQDDSTTSEESVCGLNDNSATNEYHTLAADASGDLLRSASNSGTEYSSTKAYDPEDFTVAVANFDSATSRTVYHQDGSGTTDTNSVAFSGNLDEFLIGRLQQSGSTQDFTGDIYEILVYNSILSDNDRQKVLHYLNKKYGTRAFFFSE